MNTKNMKMCESIIGKQFGKDVLTVEQYKKAARLCKQIKSKIAEIEAATTLSSPNLAAKLIMSFKKVYQRRLLKELNNLDRLISKEMMIFEETHIDEPNLALILLSA